MLPRSFSLGVMTTNEASILSRWAEREGWNPGRSDIAIAQQWQPASFIALRQGNQLVGGGSIVSYGRSYGFMGLFIVEESFRGFGLGRALWMERHRRLRDRLADSAPIGMDGVIDLVPFYEQGGFRTEWHDVRFHGEAVGEHVAGVVDELPALDQLCAFDRRYFPTDRCDFLQRWLSASGMLTATMYDSQQIIGFAALRPCVVGFKFGPVHAHHPRVASALIRHLMARVSGATVQIDVPDLNTSGIRLTEELGLRPIFSCARMNDRPTLQYAVHDIFGVTSFEFG